MGRARKKTTKPSTGPESDMRGWTRKMMWERMWETRKKLDVTETLLADERATNTTLRNAYKHDGAAHEAERKRLMGEIEVMRATQANLGSIIALALDKIRVLENGS